jgi:hypothetical protein
MNIPFCFLFITTISLLQSCSGARSYRALPAEMESKVEVAGMPHVRCWGDSFSKNFEESAVLSITQEMAANNGKLEPEMVALALSGGGGDGAFGAGILCGWTESGTRPRFKIVTGISTGALISPFAFLGSSYDAKLKEAYTTISDKDIYEEHSVLAITLSLLNIRPLPSLASHKPLRKLLEKLIDAQMLEDIAKEHARGRRLLVGSTQLDAQRLVIWDMGAIASAKTPEALELFRKVLIASASLPATLPPELFTVEADGEKYSELHVDGGVEVQVMLYENALSPISKMGKWFEKHDRPRKLYIIRNKKVLAEWSHVPLSLDFIAARTIDSLLKSQSIGDLYRLYTYAKRDKMDYQLAFIPDSFTSVAKSEFDNRYMNELFDYGYEQAKNGYPWSDHPPDFVP